MHGDDTRWDYLRGKLKNKDMRVIAHYRELETYLDTALFADYILLAWYSRLDDWGPDRNWYGANRNHPPGPFRFYMWDTEYSLFAGASPMAWVHRLFRNNVDTNTGDMVGLWHSLRKSPEFMTLFADRVFEHCFLEGALSDESSIARWRALTDFIENAVIAESARWGDARESLNEPTRTRDETFRRQVAWVEEIMRGNAEHFVEELRAEGYYPSIDPPSITDNPELTSITIDTTPGTGVELYVTVDGEDPRSPGGGIASSANLVEPGSVVARPMPSAVVKARSKKGGEWSALARHPR